VDEFSDANAVVEAEFLEGAVMGVPVDCVTGGCVPMEFALSIDAVVLRKCGQAQSGCGRFSDWHIVEQKLDWRVEREWEMSLELGG
jgi:hypothetical protein